MAFQIRTAKDRKIRPEGNYIKYQNRECQLNCTTT